MIDDEKLKMGLRYCIEGDHCYKDQCPYYDEASTIQGCTRRLAEDALQMIMDQQEEIATGNETIENLEQEIRDKNVRLLERAEQVASLLKEQEHGETFTVIDTKTGKEADEYAIALHEDWAKHLCYCDMEGWAIENDGTLLLVDECGRFAYADRERFKVVWDA